MTRIRVVSPSGPCDMEKVRAGVSVAERMGFSVELARNMARRSRGYLAGADRERAADLLAALGDPAVDIVWMSRGGYGSMRLLGFLEDAEVNGPKTLVGFSDATALMCWAGRRPGLSSVYGPSFVELGDPSSFRRGQLLAALRGLPFSLKCSGPIRPVKDVRLAGGCLAILCALLGTSHFPELGGNYLFIEDVNEPMYRIDRMLTQLKLSGSLEKAAGIAVGSFGGIRRKEYAELLELVAEAAGRRKPVLHGLRAGHVRGKSSLPLGRRAAWNGSELMFP